MEARVHFTECNGVELKLPLAEVREGQGQITQGPGGGMEVPGFSLSGVKAKGGFYMEADLLCLLLPQAGYSAPSCHLAEELQENCEFPSGVR